ncbi:lipoprotein [Rhodoferax sp. 4810]|uniref:Lipoprotein n=1 Tax=Thiospirillum jenense TaxID=1653858 RepID=A0A839HDD0_9GAMM|nr:lipoprotein [Thiospirillum jenense]MBB1074184.1 lipoprotein [Rhodoferax jenense]MBB1125258.1 lipoprotein [Thiospirillum jenense]
MHTHRLFLLTLPMLLVTFTTGLSACGQKGDLYLPAPPSPATHSPAPAKPVTPAP